MASPTPAKSRARYIGAAATVVLVIALIIFFNVVISPTLGGSSPSTSSPTREVPSPSIAEDREWTGTIQLNDTELDVTLDGHNAPQTVASFLVLGDEGYFDGISCHRLTTSGIFVLQCGDPTGTGGGGPGYNFGPIENAPADGVYPAGTLAMARLGSDASSNGSQFFIVYEESTIPADSAGGYTVFGEVTGGMDEVERIAEGGLAADQTAPAIDAVLGAIAFD